MGTQSLLAECSTAVSPLFSFKVNLSLMFDPPSLPATKVTSRLMGQAGFTLPVGMNPSLLAASFAASSVISTARTRMRWKRGPSSFTTSTLSHPLFNGGVAGSVFCTCSHGTSFSPVRGFVPGTRLLYTCFRFG